MKKNIRLYEYIRKLEAEYYMSRKRIQNISEVAAIELDLSGLQVKALKAFAKSLADESGEKMRIANELLYLKEIMDSVATIQRGHRQDISAMWAERNAD